jgi:hypothetical protein
VENDPKSEIEGRDPQLERGISEVMAQLKTPVKLPAKPPVYLRKSHELESLS